MKYFFLIFLVPLSVFSNQEAPVAVPAPAPTQTSLPQTQSFASKDLQDLEDALAKNNTVDFRNTERLIKKEIAAYKTAKNENTFENIFFLTMLYREAVLLKTPQDSKANEELKNFLFFVDAESKNMSRALAVKILTRAEAYLAKKMAPHILEMHLRYFLGQRKLVYSSKIKVLLWSNLIDSLEEQGQITKALEEALKWSEMKETEVNRFEALNAVLTVDFAGRKDVYKIAGEKIKKIILPFPEPRIYQINALLAFKNKDYAKCEAVFKEAQKDPRSRPSNIASLEARLKRCYVAEKKFEQAEKLRTNKDLPPEVGSGVLGQMLRADIILAASQQQFQKAFAICNLASSNIPLKSAYSFLKMFAVCKVLQSEGEQVTAENLAALEKVMPTLKAYAQKSQEVRLLLQLIADIDAKKRTKDLDNKIKSVLQEEDVLAIVLNNKPAESAK